MLPLTGVVIPKESSGTWVLSRSVAFRIAGFCEVCRLLLKSGKIHRVSLLLCSLKSALCSAFPLTMLKKECVKTLFVLQYVMCAYLKTKKQKMKKASASRSAPVLRMFVEVFHLVVELSPANG
ncbi:hypothetical protein FQA47_015192 [Oryzias melastigma]|uniref:Uncharacterized protein n=1 Tax=Oryzias melastigma TaxID=30732 RepID=A0A834F1Q0_ORYME|nr:hypothetical protein FQA47_015192 [Oryzias melastigma]